MLTAGFFGRTVSRPELFARCLVEFSIMFPGAAFALLPARRCLRFRSRMGCVVAVLTLACLAAACAGACVRWELRTRLVMIPASALLLALYCLIVKMDLTKKLFCFFNAAAMCVFCSMYTIFLMAPVEFANGILNIRGPFTLKSGAACLLLTLCLCAVFFRTIAVKLPALLAEESINSVWRVMFASTLAVSSLIYWITPNWTSVVMTGRVRPVSLIMMCAIPAAMLAFYHMLWVTAGSFKHSASLQQENTVLRMENKRYNSLHRHIEEVRALRHDFRHHLLVIDRYLDAGQTDDARRYMGQLKDNASRTYTGYCRNRAVDAVAAHYAALAAKSGARIEWKLDLDEKLPVRESDYCATLGNLLDNALRAVSALPEERRRVKVISSAMSGSMLGISVDNPFEGKLDLDENGLPRSVRENGGIGLVSVSNIVRRYGGFMNIKTDGNVFSVDILMYGDKSGINV